MRSRVQLGRLLRSGLLLASSLAGGEALAGQTFPQTVFFGDSHTDSGFFRPLLPLSVRPVTGEFTTNPADVWSQILARFYGTSAEPNGNGQTGSNHAAGGARVAVNTTGALGPIPSLATQLNNYLASAGGRADPDALYIAWGGMNDILTVTNAGADRTVVLPAAAGGEVALVQALRDAGARYVLVPTVYDLGLTPAFRAQGPAAQADATGLSETYNEALFAGLAAEGLSVIPLDTFTLLQEVVAAPGDYGFLNITGTACQPQITANSLTCNPTSLVIADAPRTYLFADGIHLSGAGHSLIADLAISVLEAPRLAGMLPLAATSSGRMRFVSLVQPDAGNGGDGVTVWVQARGGVGSGLKSGSDTAQNAVSGGADWSQGALRLGLFASYGDSGDHDDQRAGGHFSYSDLTFGGRAAWRGQEAWVDAIFSYSQLDFEIERVVTLGAATRRHTGSTDASNASLGISSGYEFENGPVRHGPVASMLVQWVSVDGFAENQPALSTSLAYPGQDVTSVVGSIGWQASYRGAGTLVPYIRVTYDREFNEPPSQAFAVSQSIAGSLPYAVPATALADDSATVSLGASGDILGLDAVFGVSAIMADGGPSNLALHLRLGSSF